MIESTHHSPSPLPAARLLIVDGHAYAYRAFYAIRELRSPAGAPTNAIYGFIKTLGKLLGTGTGPQDHETTGPQNLGSVVRGPVVRGPLFTHALVVWDGGLSAERTAALPGYKAQRPEMPAELGAQIDGIIEYLEAAGVASYCEAGVEADDYIASVARRAAGLGWEVVIASADKDFMQLVTSDERRVTSEGKIASESRHPTPDTRPGGSIGLLQPNDKTGRVWGAAEVRAKAGVEPRQIVDWLALVGDSVDNIPGVRGVGPKTASSLLKEFGSVSGLYERLGEVKSEKLRGALAESAELVRRNVGLVRLKDDLASEISAEGLALKGAEEGRVGEMFRRWGFRGMLAELEISYGPLPPTPPLPEGQTERAAFGGECEKQPRQAVLL